MLGRYKQIWVGRSGSTGTINIRETGAICGPGQLELSQLHCLFGEKVECGNVEGLVVLTHGNSVYGLGRDEGRAEQGSLKCIFSCLWENWDPCRPGQGEVDTE